MTEKKYVSVIAADEVTDEIITMAHGIVDGWYSDGPVDWTDFLERLERMPLDSGETVDLGDQMDSPAIRKIKREIRAYRKL